ncbi:MAG: hypothetical protein E6F97_03725 [Actinobacteria bacterium]|nr:MAG: hypothetical protein E6F97_03725 [Actinomycetota bacterium]
MRDRDRRGDLQREDGDPPGQRSLHLRRVAGSFSPGGARLPRLNDAIEAIRAGRPVVLPTRQPIALLAGDVDRLLERVPELDERLLRRLLPGAYTLVLPNPAGRYPWLTGDRPETIGVRVPELSAPAAEVLREVGAVLATSANRHGGPDPRRLGDVPEEIRSACGALVDAGELPGTASTVLDLTGDEPRVLREGVVPAAEALATVGSLRE